MKKGEQGLNIVWMVEKTLRGEKMKTIDKIQCVAVICIVVMIATWIRVPASRPVIDGAIQYVLGIDSSETSSNDTKYETMTMGSGKLLSEAESKEGIDSYRESVDDEPKTENKGLQEHENAGIQVTTSQPVIIHLINVSAALVVIIVVVVVVLVLLRVKKKI